MKNNIILIIIFLLSSCSVGPDYEKPNVENPKAFKEKLSWKQASPKDNEIRGKWWEVFNDSELNKLEEQVIISNQNIKAAEAAYRQASALTSEARASYFPTLNASSSFTRNKISTATTTNNFSGIKQNYNASLSATWEPDLWGRIRRTTESNQALEEASAADLASAKLSAGADLAINYLNLRTIDEQKRLLNRTVENYEEALKITENQYESGIAAQSDVLQIRAQMESNKAQAINLDIERAQLEHAIAILIGKAPADFSIEPANVIPLSPLIPISVPSELLERRPDIASAERMVASANAKIGIAKSAYFPDLTLSALGGFQGSSYTSWFSPADRIWSVGPALTAALFDAGLRKAQTKSAIAAYDGAVATYRQTVLGAFQEVEDNLVALRVLEEQNTIEQKAVRDSIGAARIVHNQYEVGTVTYLNVITALNTELNEKLNALNITKSQLNASVGLIKALGGGWGTHKRPELVPIYSGK